MSNYPPSVPAGSHEMHDYRTPETPRVSPNITPTITPYLGLRSRLSQVWINRWTILLLLVLARTLIAIQGINSDLDAARREALSACTGVESMASAMASMPHYMSQGINEMAADGVEKAVHGLSEMAMLSVTGVEEIVVFMIDTMTSTYACLITLAVGGSLHVAISALEDAQTILNSTIQTLGHEMATLAGDFETEYNTFLNAFSKIASTFGGVTPPQALDLSTQLTALDRIKISTNIDPVLNDINKSIPTFQQVQNFTNNVIRIPFEFVKGEINSSLSSYRFDRSVFPVPNKEQLTFCSDDDGINSFFDKLVDLASLGKKLFIVVLLIAALLVMIPMAYREIRRWRTMQERSQLVRSSAHDPMDVVYIVSRPYTSTAGIQVSNAFKSNRRQILTRWVIAYATSDAALFVLALAIAGFFSCACQAILLKVMEKEVPVLSNEVGAFADKVIHSLNNASESWAVGTNGAIDAANRDINDQMLGWVNVTTGALNDTLNTFVNDTMSVLNTTFSGTVLYEPIVGVLDCLVLLKVQGIQKALTWISDNAKVNIPNLPNNTFSVGAVVSIAEGDDPGDSFLSNPGDDASDQISAVVARFTGKLEEAIRTEALVATVIFLIWVSILLIGIVRALFLWCRRDKTRGEGGPNLSDFHEDPDFYVVAASGGFVDVPLGEMKGSAAQVRSYTPAPKYEFPAGNGNRERDLGSEEKFEEAHAGRGDSGGFFGGGEGDVKNKM